MDETDTEDWGEHAWPILGFDAHGSCKQHHQPTDSTHSSQLGQDRLARHEKGDKQRHAETQSQANRKRRAIGYHGAGNGEHDQTVQQDRRDGRELDAFLTEPNPVFVDVEVDPLGGQHVFRPLGAAGLGCGRCCCASGTGREEPEVEGCGVIRR